MAEAVKAMINYDFEELGFIRMEATVDPENMASKKVLERTGFQLEGTLRKRYLYKDRFHDELIYGILKEE